ncbi:hypothetical protein C8A03DRAFT_32117 [Achaetomium macrosporum]|uniref:Uncharacterized protein n=1 Tax=Achaetomium macrosporum TaxID=79813 RepID=A0AAN7HGS0_9PEZI|nr:hypothetical protein C8A03DRAFT_32117 [Achaetomium macrosporum]
MASVPKSTKPGQRQRPNSSTTAGTSSSRADDSIPFRLQKQNDENPDLAPNVPSGDPCHEAVAACIRLAFALLRVNDACCLIEMGQEAVKDLDPRYSLSHRPLSKIPEWAMVFWCRLSLNFVNVKLTNTKACGGWFEPSSKCAAKGRDGWQPGDAGTMFLNKFAVESMVMAKVGTTPAHREAYDRFLFVLGLAIARGVVTCFLRTLVGPEVPIEGPHGLDPGCLWEYRALGGLVKNYEEAGHALGQRQAGTVWLESLSGISRQVKVPSFGGNIPHVFTLPLETVGKKVDASALTNRTMEQVRDQASPRAGPPTGHIKLARDARPVQGKKASPAQGNPAHHHHTSNVSGGSNASTGNSTNRQERHNTAAPLAAGKSLRQLVTARYRPSSNTGPPDVKKKPAPDSMGT